MQQHVVHEHLPRKEFLVTISSKGQVTLPAEVRHVLGVKRKEKVTLVVEGKGEVRLQVPKYPDVDSVVGRAGKLASPLTWQEMREIAREDALISELHD